MSEKKTPLRMCVACREMKDKRELIRVVKSADGQICLDFTGKKNGRGAYICPTEQCLQKCIKTRQLSRAFKCEIAPEVYARLKEELEIAKR